MKKQSGFILILTTFIIAACVFLISFVINRTNAYYKMSNFWVKSEKARVLAYSGIDVAISQLVDFDVKKLKEDSSKKDDKESSLIAAQDGDKKDEKKDKKSPSKKFLDFLFNKLNHWQKFTLTEKSDEIDGEIEIYISCEEGKINLNKLIFAIQSKKSQNAESVKDMLKDKQEKDKGKDKEVPISEGEKKIYEFINEKLKPIFVSQKKSLSLDAKRIDALLSKISKRYKDGLDDVTELLVLESKEFKQWKDDIFLNHELYDKNYIALSDLFTVSTENNKITPLLFSRAIQILLGFKEKTPELDKIPKDFLNSLQGQIDWKKLWDPVISSFYSKEYQNLPEEVKNSLFEAKFEPNTFSVVSYGKVGSVVKKICAIIKRNKKETDKDKPFIIQKVYCLD